MTVFSGDEFAEWCGGAWRPAPPQEIAGVSTDTRSLAAGELFFALQGPIFDGHAFLESARSRGACGAVVSRRSSPTPRVDLPLLYVDNTGEALRASGAAYRAAVGARIVAVTGSAGKSTVKEMTADLLAAAMPTARTRGNFNNEIGIPLSLLAMARTDRAGVFEIGISHPGEMKPLCRLLDPAWGVVTNVGPAHIGAFHTVEAIAREKAGLLRHLKSNGVAVLCKDNVCFKILRSASAGRVITVSMTGTADYTCTRRSHSQNGATATIREASTGNCEEIVLPLPGDHQIVNAMMAIAVARGHGVPWPVIRSVLKNYAPMEMRWQQQTIAGANVINDAYNANPLSMRAAIKAFADAGGLSRKWLVLGGMLELGEDEKAEHNTLGRDIAGGRWTGLITVGDLGAIIATGAEEAGYDPARVVRCRSHEEAAGALAAMVSGGDAVLLKASRGIGLERTLECWSRRAESRQPRAAPAK